MPEEFLVLLGLRSTASEYHPGTLARVEGVFRSTGPVPFLPVNPERGLQMEERIWSHGNSSDLLKEAVVEPKHIVLRSHARFLWQFFVECGGVVGKTRWKYHLNSCSLWYR